MNAAQVTPEQLSALLGTLAEALPAEQAAQARTMAQAIRATDWYHWDKLMHSKEARAIDLNEAAGTITSQQASNFRIALALRTSDRA